MKNINIAKVINRLIGFDRWAKKRKVIVCIDDRGHIVKRWVKK